MDAGDQLLVLGRHPVHAVAQLTHFRTEPGFRLDPAIKVLFQAGELFAGFLQLLINLVLGRGIEIDETAKRGQPAHGFLAIRYGLVPLPRDLEQGLVGLHDLHFKLFPPGVGGVKALPQCPDTIFQRLFPGVAIGRFDREFQRLFNDFAIGEDILKPGVLLIQLGLGGRDLGLREVVVGGHCVIFELQREELRLLVGYFMILHGTGHHEPGEHAAKTNQDDKAHELRPDGNRKIFQFPAGADDHLTVRKKFIEYGLQPHLVILLRVAQNCCGVLNNKTDFPANINRGERPLKFAVFCLFLRRGCDERSIVFFRQSCNRAGIVIKRGF